MCSVAVLPTGVGKSLCFAYLPSMYDQLLPLSELSIVVVTPLTAIMNNKVTPLYTGGFSACYIAGNQEANVKNNVLVGKYQLVLFTPEIRCTDILKVTSYISCTYMYVCFYMHIRRSFTPIHVVA